MRPDLGVAAARPGERCRIAEVELPQVVHDVAAGHHQHAFIAQRRKLPRKLVVISAGPARVHAELNHGNVGFRIHRDEHAPGAVVEPAARVEPQASLPTSSSDAPRERGFARRRVAHFEEARGKP